MVLIISFLSLFVCFSLLHFRIWSSNQIKIKSNQIQSNPIPSNQCNNVVRIVFVNRQVSLGCAVANTRYHNSTVKWLFLAPETLLLIVLLLLFDAVQNVSILYSDALSQTWE
jgi:hypothetical protein